MSAKDEILTREGRARIRGFVAFVDDDSAILPALNIIDSQEDEIATRQQQMDEMRTVIADVTAALDECDLYPGGSLVDRIRTLSHHNREWKDMYAETTNRLHLEALPSLDKAKDLLRRAMNAYGYPHFGNSIWAEVERFLAKNPNPSGQSTAEASHSGMEASGPVGLGPAQ